MRWGWSFLHIGGRRTSPVTTGWVRRTVSGLLGGAAAATKAWSGGMYGNRYNPNNPPGVPAHPTLQYGDWESNWDGMDPHPDASDDLKKRLSKAPTRHLILVRHGQYDLQCEDDPPLTTLGREQARLTGKYLARWNKGVFKPDPKAKEGPIVFSAIYTSDMIRARQTGEIIAEELKDAMLHPADPLLSEGAPCPVPHWNPTPRELFVDGARIEAAFRKYCHRAVDGYEAFETEKHMKNKQPVSYEGPDTYELVACHGNVIRYFVCRALQLPPNCWLRFATYNCGLTHLVFYPNGRVSLYGFGDVGHLAIEEVTYH
eukprot:Sspe_Gene.86415::Locus_57084_Transcript_1_1_Confidence_1.000_Length_1160::g.86415::m.86415/K15637/PGAM5; serine/threonine-protein phosphatase PGAM5